MEAHTLAERPDLAGRVASADVWPEYNMHGDVLNRYWGRLAEELPEYQLVLAEGDDVVAELHTAPIPWDGTVEGLPKGIDGAIEDAFERPGPGALCALAAEILPGHRGRGLAERTLAEMRAVAERHGLPALVAPVRPSWKERYPLAPIESYMRWTRDDGLPLDPWLRVHVRAGGELVRAEPESLRITGTVADWEAWTEQAFPESGAYVFPHGLALVDIDRERDLGSYWEPNVWVLHRA